MDVRLKKELNCCHCQKAFAVLGARMCDGCNPCDACRGARSADEGCYFGNCGTHTLVCPYCGHCACDRIEQWEREGSIVRLDGPLRNHFDWVHHDLIA